MNENEFKALVSLLEDDDPGIEEHVQSKLLSMGETVIPRLEAIWESEDGDERLQGRIEDIIHVIQSKRSISALQTWLQSNDPNLLHGWYLVSRYQYPELDFLPFKKEINRLVNRIWLEFRPGMNVPERLLVINRMLFNQEKYRGREKELTHPDNYFLNSVIDLHRGNPMSLGLLYICICHELDIAVGGIPLPGYFILTYQDKSSEFYIDVFRKGTFFMRSDLERFLKEIKAENSPEYFKPVPLKALIIELIRAIKKSFGHYKKYEKEQEWLWMIRSLNLDLKR